MSYLSGSPINLSPLAFSMQYTISFIMAKRKKGGSLIDSGSESDDYDSEDTRTIFSLKPSTRALANKSAMKKSSSKVSAVKKRKPSLAKKVTLKNLPKQIKNKKKKNSNVKKKGGIQLDLLGAGMQYIDKAPLMLSKLVLLTDEIYGKKVPKEMKGQLFCTSSPVMRLNKRNSPSSIKTV